MYFLNTCLYSISLTYYQPIYKTIARPQSNYNEYLFFLITIKQIVLHVPNILYCIKLFERCPRWEVAGGERGRGKEETTRTVDLQDAAVSPSSFNIWGKNRSRNGNHLCVFVFFRLKFLLMTTDQISTPLSTVRNIIQRQT